MRGRKVQGKYTEGPLEKTNGVFSINETEILRYRKINKSLPGITKKFCTQYK